MKTIPYHHCLPSPNPPSCSSFRSVQRVYLSITSHCIAHLPSECVCVCMLISLKDLCSQSFDFLFMKWAAECNNRAGFWSGRRMNSKHIPVSKAVCALHAFKNIFFLKIHTKAKIQQVLPLHIARKSKC